VFGYTKLHKTLFIERVGVAHVTSVDVPAIVDLVVTKLTAD